MENKPSLIEVQAYFKNAKEVRCLTIKSKVAVIDVNTIEEQRIGDKYFWSNPKDQYLALWSDKYGYAEIVSSLDGKLERTQAIETIKELMTKHEIKTTEL